MPDDLTDGPRSRDVALPAPTAAIDDVPLTVTKELAHLAVSHSAVAALASAKSGTMSEYRVTTLIQPLAIGAFADFCAENFEGAFEDAVTALALARTGRILKLKLSTADNVGIKKNLKTIKRKIKGTNIDPNDSNLISSIYEKAANNTQRLTKLGLEENEHIRKMLFSALDITSSVTEGTLRPAVTPGDVQFLQGEINRPLDSDALKSIENYLNYLNPVLARGPEGAEEQVRDDEVEGVKRGWLNMGLNEVASAGHSESEFALKSCVEQASGKASGTSEMLADGDPLESHIEPRGYSHHLAKIVKEWSNSYKRSCSGDLGVLREQSEDEEHELSEQDPSGRIWLKRSLSRDSESLGLGVEREELGPFDRGLGRPWRSASEDKDEALQMLDSSQERPPAENVVVSSQSR